MNGINKYIEVWKEIVKEKVPLLLVGQVGIGKTEIWKEIAEKEGKDIIITHLARSSNTDFLIPIIKGDSITYATNEMFSKLEKGNCIWLLDEYDRADGMTRNAILSALNERIFDGKKLSDDTWIVLLANQENSKDTNILNEAEITRCAVFNLNQVFELNNLGRDSDYFQYITAIANNKNIDRSIVSFLYAYPEYLFKKDAETGEQFTTPRGWFNLSRLLPTIEKLGNKLQEQTIISGVIGTESSEKFLVYHNLHQNMPTVEEILKMNKSKIEDMTSEKKIITLDLFYTHVKDEPKDLESVLSFTDKNFGREWFYILIRMMIEDKKIKKALIENMQKNTLFKNNINGIIQEIVDDLS